MAGVSTLVPSLALMPATSFCEMRISGGGGKTPTGSDPCALWQSTQVAWRLLLSNMLSAASCGLVEAGKWMPDLGRGVLCKHIGVGRHRRDVRPPLWQAMQSCSFCPRSSRAGPLALCGAWQEMQASAATVV